MDISSITRAGEPQPFQNASTTSHPKTDADGRPDGHRPETPKDHDDTLKTSRPISLPEQPIAAQDNKSNVIEAKSDDSDNSSGDTYQRNEQQNAASQANTQPKGSFPAGSMIDIFA